MLQWQCPTNGMARRCSAAAGGAQPVVATYAAGALSELAAAWGVPGAETRLPA